MKREIKFRAWDKDAGIMIYSDNDNDDYWWEINPLKCGYVSGMSGGDTFIPPQPIADYIDNIMQFTGLKDKNGKEIYEGDIVSPVMMNGTITSGTVLFHAGSFMVKQIGAEWLIDDLYRYDTEVIGNIYENPELINNQQILK